MYVCCVVLHIHVQCMYISAHMQCDDVYGFIVQHLYGVHLHVADTCV